MVAVFDLYRLCWWAELKVVSDFIQFYSYVIITWYSESSMKVQELEKEILDSREKTEFYRTKMQELVSILWQYVLL